MSKIDNLDILLLGFIIILSLIFFIYYPKVKNDVNIEQKIESNKIINNNINDKTNNTNIQPNINNSLNTYNDESYYDINGFQNELIPKYKQYISKSFENYFIEPNKNIPLDHTHICKKSGDCPPTKDQKYDIPMKNVPLCYLKDNKETRLSKQIKNKEQYGITEFNINQNENNIINLLNKNTNELPIANININFLEKTNSSFISKNNNQNI
jgi:hypothetical protein